MQDTKEVPVEGKTGPLGVLTRRDDAKGQAYLRLSDGRELLVPAAYLALRSDGSYYLPVTTDELVTNERQSQEVVTEKVIPVVAEDLVVDKQEVPAGGIRVRKVVEEHDETVGISLMREHADVRRVPIDRDVDGPQPVRRDGDTIILPIVEEVLVVEKRLRLKEELHITKHGTEERAETTVTLRREQAIIERFDADGRVTAEEPSARRNRVLPNA